PLSRDPRLSQLTLFTSSPTRRSSDLYAKKVIPYHRWIGTTALFIVIIHASKVISTFGFSLQNMKVLSGTLTGLILIGMVTSGWLRLIWPSKRKRMTHIYLGLTMFFLIVIHILL